MYDFIRRLYSCPDAVTYQAIDRSSGRPVAIKISNDLNVDHGDDSTMDPKEVRLLTCVQSHPRIVKFLRWHPFPDNGCYAMITEWYDNVSPEENLFGRPRLIRRYMFDILAAVYHCHQRQILYRDLKPSNALWLPDVQHAMLIDFDVATFLSDDHPNDESQQLPPNSMFYTRPRRLKRFRMHRSCVGTDGYMAAEITKISQAKASKRPWPHRGYGRKVDVYSAGVILAQLLFGITEDEVADDDNLSAKGPSMRVMAEKELLRSPLAAKLKEPMMLDADALEAKDGDSALLDELLRLQACELAVQMLEENPMKRPSIRQVIEHQYFDIERVTAEFDVFNPSQPNNRSITSPSSQF